MLTFGSDCGNTKSDELSATLGLGLIKSGALSPGTVTAQMAELQSSVAGNTRNTKRDCLNDDACAK